MQNCSSAHTEASTSFGSAPKKRSDKNFTPRSAPPVKLQSRGTSGSSGSTFTTVPFLEHKHGTRWRGRSSNTAVVRSIKTASSMQSQLSLHSFGNMTVLILFEKTALHFCGYYTILCTVVFGGAWVRAWSKTNWHAPTKKFRIFFSDVSPCNTVKKDISMQIYWNEMKTMIQLRLCVPRL